MFLRPGEMTITIDQWIQPPGNPLTTFGCRATGFVAGVNAQVRAAILPPAQIDPFHDPDPRGKITNRLPKDGPSKGSQQ